MNISPINCANKNVSPNFRANLWIDKSVKEIIEPNKITFMDAAEKYGNWLKTEHKNILSTVTIRENTALNPQIALRHQVTEYTFDYPHEESGCPISRMKDEYEDLEFEFNNRKCGFWFDKNSNAEKLFDDFKNMFYFLLSGE